MIRNTEISDEAHRGTIPHGSSNDFPNARNKDISGFGNTRVMRIRLHVEGFNRSREMSKDNRFTNCIDHESLRGYSVNMVPFAG